MLKNLHKLLYTFRIYSIRIQTFVVRSLGRNFQRTLKLNQRYLNKVYGTLKKTNFQFLHILYSYIDLNLWRDFRNDGLFFRVYKEIIYFIRIGTYSGFGCLSYVLFVGEKIIKFYYLTKRGELPLFKINYAKIENFKLSGGEIGAGKVFH